MQEVGILLSMNRYYTFPNGYDHHMHWQERSRLAHTKRRVTRLVVISCFLLTLFDGGLSLSLFLLFLGCFLGYFRHLCLALLGLHEAETRATWALEQELHCCGWSTFPWSLTLLLLLLFQTPFKNREKLGSFAVSLFI